MRDDIRRALNRWFRQHHGIITLDQARQLGVSEHEARVLVRRGDWVQLHRGTYGTADAPPSPTRTLAAALAAAGPEAAAGHLSAAWLWELVPRPPTRPQLILPDHRNCRIPGVSILRTAAPREILPARGLRATSATETILDLAGRVPPDRLAVITDRALATQLTSVSTLTRASRADASQLRHGRSALRRSLEARGMIGAPAPSVLEAAMDRLVHRYRLPTPEVQVVTGPDGEYRLDYAYPPIQFAFEVDGYVWHFSPEHAQRDHARRNRLITAGWTLLIYTWRDVLHTPDHVAGEILTNHRSLAARSPISFLASTWENTRTES